MMAAAETRLDGNAAAGLLAEIFSFDITTASAICGGCQAVALVGALPTYGLPMGVIIRCPSCDTVMLRLTRHRETYHLDLRGVRTLRIAAAG